MNCEVGHTDEKVGNLGVSLSILIHMHRTSGVFLKDCTCNVLLSKSPNHAGRFVFGRPLPVQLGAYLSIM